MTTPRMAAAMVLSIVAFLGLAIAGAAALAVFSYQPLIAVALVTIALGFAALFSEGHIGSGVRRIGPIWSACGISALNTTLIGPHMAARHYVPSRSWRRRLPRREAFHKAPSARRPMETIP